jgi:uncharacterized protein (TIGR02466 family)
MTNTIIKESYFSSNVFFTENTNFLNTISEIAEELLKIKKIDTQLDGLYPVVMTDNFYEDKRANNFCEFVASSCWGVLDSEGYAVDKYYLYFSDMWVQEHHKYSSMEPHVHGFNACISGFYFLETPENCSKIVIHDPRPGKVQINLMQKNKDVATDASEMINFLPKPGMLVMMASSLPHSFTRHASETPIKFVHFNIVANFKPPESKQFCNTNVEIV